MADPFWLNVAALLAIATAGVSLMLLFVSVLSWTRLKSPRLLFAGGAFAVLVVKGALAAWRIVAERDADLAAVGLDALILAFLYASVAKR